MRLRRRDSKAGPRAHRRFQQRAAKLALRPWKAVAALGLLLAVLGGVVFLFGYSRAFVVQDVVVEGAEGGGLAQDVRARAAVPQGLPMARVDTAAVGERVLSQDPRVAQVEVGRSWPSTITLRVTPREPAVAVQQAGQPLRVADSQGVVYEEATEQPAGLPLVHLPAGAADPAAVRGALAMHQAMPHSLRAQMGPTQVTPAGHLQFSLGEVTVVWGAPEQPTLKARVLDALLAQDEISVEDADEAVTIDLGVPGTPVVTGLTPPQEG